MYLATANGLGLQKLSEISQKKEKNNVSFSILFTQGKLEECISILVNSNRFSEAALFSRTYIPSLISPIVKLWKSHLGKLSYEFIVNSIIFRLHFYNSKNKALFNELSNKKLTFPLF